MSKKCHRNTIKKYKGNTGKEQHAVQTQISEITVGAAWSDHLSTLTQKHSLSLSTRQEREKVLSLKSIMIIIKIMIIINNNIFIDIVWHENRADKQTAPIMNNYFFITVNTIIITTIITNISSSSSSSWLLEADLIFVTKITNYVCGEKSVMWRNFRFL